jgi:hypothetical protein
VQHVNHAPVAEAKNVQTSGGQSVAVVLSGSDPDNDPLTFKLVSGPAHGTLSGTLPNLIYTPEPGYYGPDSLTYVVNDGSLTSAPAIVTITSTEVNSAPEADSKSVQTAVNRGLLIQLTGSDPDRDKLTFSVVTPPSHGTLEMTSRHALYIPDAGYIGKDAFTYQASDGKLTSAPATVTITVATSSILSRRR